MHANTHYTCESIWIQQWVITGLVEQLTPNVCVAKLCISMVDTLYIRNVEWFKITHVRLGRHIVYAKCGGLWAVMIMFVSVSVLRIKVKWNICVV